MNIWKTTWNGGTAVKCLESMAPVLHSGFQTTCWVCDLRQVTDPEYNLKEYKIVPILFYRSDMGIKSYMFGTIPGIKASVVMNVPCKFNK